MTEPLIQHVSDTAFMVAHHRAVESARKDALFSDPLAARLAGERGRAMAGSLSTSRMTGWTVAIRTRIIDDFVAEAIARGADTVVNLGAGLDTRPYRLPLPSALTWIEVDYPDVIAYKQDKLAGETPRCRLERIGLDLAQRDPRRQFLGRLTGRTLVMTEGVVPYLDLDQAGALADDLRALPDLDGWIVDYVSPEALAYRSRKGLDRHMSQAPFKFRPADWGAFFASHGWDCGEMRYLAVMGKRLGRRAPLPWMARAIINITRAFASRQTRDRLSRFAGYALLVPKRSDS
jgi:methyltransferase (TIGR00027 family)